MSTSPASPEFKKEGAAVPESDLARSLGIARDDLKKMRARLEREQHWTGGDGKPILITPDGVAALTALLASEKEAALALQQAASATQSGEQYESLVVVRIGSPRVLLAKKPPAEDDPPEAEPELLRIMVRSSVHFTPGMILEKCRRSHQFADVAHYHGRYPRRRGKY